MKRSILLLAGLFLIGAGCDDSLTRDDDGDDYLPAEGQGALFVNNDTAGTNLRVFIDGEQQPGRVGDGRNEAYDLDPGLVRVLLVDTDDEDVLYREAVDILVGRTSVLDVTDGGVSERLE